MVKYPSKLLFLVIAKWASAVYTNRHFQDESQMLICVPEPELEFDLMKDHVNVTAPVTSIRLYIEFSRPPAFEITIQIKICHFL